MSHRVSAFLPALLALLFGLTACGAPRYAPYSSVHGDYKCAVPWGWSVITDDQGTAATSTTFIGPLEPDFYLGLPSLQVKWYKYGAPHELRNGSAEVYASADDYITQMLDKVYGKDRTMEAPVHDIILKNSGRKGKAFVVLSGVEAMKGSHFGVSKDPDTGKLYNVRRHAFVVVPMNRGFYAIIYPATRDGFSLYEKQFYELVNSFVPSTDGPGGPPAAAPAGFASKGKP